MIVRYGPPDLSKIENLLKKIVSTPEETRERQVLERYKRLAGFVQNGQMVNRDKETRARQWVKEQEEKEIIRQKKSKWWERSWVQVIFLLGAIAGIVGLVFIFI